MINSLAFSPDGKYLCTVSLDSKIQLIETGLYTVAYIFDKSKLSSGK